ncbi:hypothetical protein [Suttonella indologenes]|uniref:Uncharacterized protein n=1 Tax=Suttonella indologenes TaxID=13276 RepID=A0A380MYA6_9GAMM|nr:hypothetical protein [Suttonella indologenes]SUO96873.1 Uncharacterised protein [Suttonella indologenes]
MKKLMLTAAIATFASASYADAQTFSQVGDAQAFNAALSAIKQTSHTDAIAEAIFDNQFALAALSPEEMNETEGAFAWGTLGNGMLIGSAYNVSLNNIMHYLKYDEFASWDSNAQSAVLGAILGARAFLPGASANLKTWQTLTAREKYDLLTPKDKIEALVRYHAYKTDIVILGATFPYENSNN